MDDPQHHQLRDKLQLANRIVVLTGAGISAESGVPTFRGEGGLWRRYRAIDLATPEAFSRNPHLVWEFYNYRRELLAPLKPNTAHTALAELESHKQQFTLLTQNIDGLHQAAGSRNVVELHGNIWRVRCTRCGIRKENRQIPLPDPPCCESCGAILRPDVIWFGESLDPDILQISFEILDNCDLMLVIGTSGIVQPAASMGVYAKKKGAFVAEINLEPTPSSHIFHISLQGRAGDLVPQLISQGKQSPVKTGIV